MADKKPADKGTSNVPAAQKEKGLQLAVNNGIQVPKENFNLLAKFKEVDSSDLLELTSEILKLEASESWDGFIVNEKQTMTSTDEGGEDYEGFVGYDENKNKVILADAVIIGVMTDFFAKNPDQSFAVCRVSCKGMRKSSRDAKKEYRDITVRILPPQRED